MLTVNPNLYQHKLTIFTKPIYINFNSFCRLIIHIEIPVKESLYLLDETISNLRKALCVGTILTQRRIWIIHILR